MSGCTELVNAASAGVAPALRAVDCVAGEITASAFARLFGANGALAPVLTVILTLYIAVFAVMLLTGRTSLGLSTLVPRMLTMGLVLTFATSWIAYSQVLWNLAVAGPDWIATVLTGSRGSASLIFADRIDIVFAAIGEAGEMASTATAVEGSAPAAGGSTSLFQPADIMWLGALLLLLGTVGVLLTARIALAVLMALGPVFLVLALFSGTRELTVGWLKGVAMTALVPLLVVLGGAVTLEMLVPVISALSQGAAFGEIGGRAALALFLVASVHVALMAMVLKVAATIVSGWRIFGLAGEARNPGEARVTAPAVAAPPLAQPLPATTGSASRAPVTPLVRSLEGTSEPSRDSRGESTPRRRAATLVAGGGVAQVHAFGPGRAHGIGSRFRAASNDSGRMLRKSASREMTK